MVVVTCTPKRGLSDKRRPAFRHWAFQAAANSPVSPTSAQSAFLDEVAMWFQNAPAVAVHLAGRSSVRPVLWGIAADLRKVNLPSVM